MTADKTVVSMVVLGAMSVGDLPRRRVPLVYVQVNHNRCEEQAGLLNAVSVSSAQPAGSIADAAQRVWIADAPEMFRRIAPASLVVSQESARHV